MNSKAIQQVMILICFPILLLIHVQIVETIESPEIESGDEYQDNNLCGPNSLFVSCCLLGIEAKRDELACLAGMDERGTTLYGLKKAAVQKGLYAVGIETTVPQLLKLPPPIIAQVDRNHFLIVNGFDGDWVYIIDAPKDPYAMPLTDFGRMWTGRALVVSKKKVEIEFSRFPYTFVAFLSFFTVVVLFLIFALRRKRGRVNTILLIM